MGRVLVDDVHVEGGGGLEGEDGVTDVGGVPENFDDFRGKLEAAV